jgi:membrane fusion protein (multidrug efflux system)
MIVKNRILKENFSMNNRHNKKVIFVIMALLSFSLPSLAEKPADGAMPVFKADYFVVNKPQNKPVKLKYPTQLNAFKKVTVVARVAGVLQAKHFVEGQMVKKGDLLYSIEDDIYKARVDVAKANLKINVAALEKAERSWKRIKNLFKRKTVSAELKDSALLEYKQASAGISLAKANLREAQIDLDYAKVRAPIGGVIGLKKVDLGDYVGANPPTKLIQITQNSQLYAEFSMPFRDYANIMSGLWAMPESGKVSVELEVENKMSGLKGELDFMDVNIDRLTSTVKMRARIDNSQHTVMAGGFVRVILSGIVQKNVITIPQKAVLQNPLGTIVFIADQGRVNVKPVVIGREVGDQYIVKGGPLVSGDKVIVNNFFRLKPGAKVELDQAINKEGK